MQSLSPKGKLYPQALENQEEKHPNWHWLRASDTRGTILSFGHVYFP